MKTTTQSVPDRKISRKVCLFFEIRMLVLLNSAELLRRALAPAKVEVLRICSEGLWAAAAGMEQICSGPDLMEVNTYTKVTPMSTWWNLRVTDGTSVSGIINVHTSYMIYVY